MKCQKAGSPYEDMHEEKEATFKVIDNRDVEYFYCFSCLGDFIEFTDIEYPILISPVE